MKDWPIINIESWKHFIEVIESSNTHDSYLPHWSFRGQTNSNWTLKPSLCRQLYNTNISTDSATRFERTVYREFTLNAHNYEDFKKRDFEKGDEIVWFAIMQHYGCPTRLLDWTDSPFIGLYFAIESSFDKDGALFLFNRTVFRSQQCAEFTIKDHEILNHPNENYLASIITNYASKRSNAQQGVFTISSNILADHYPLINKALENHNSSEKQYNIKLVIPKDLKREFLARLKSMNVKSNMIYPDLFGQGRYLRDLIEIRIWEKENRTKS